MPLERKHRKRYTDWRRLLQRSRRRKGLWRRARRFPYNRKPHRILQAEAAQDRLCAVVTPAHGDTFFIERRADFDRLVPVQLGQKWPDRGRSFDTRSANDAINTKPHPAVHSMRRRR